MMKGTAINFLPLELRMVEKGQRIINDDIITSMSFITRIPICVNQHDVDKIDYQHINNELQSKLKNVTDRIELIENVNNDPEVELNIVYDFSCPYLSIRDTDLEFARKYFPSNAYDKNVLRDLYGAMIFDMHNQFPFIYLYVGLNIEIKAEPSHINRIKLKSPHLFNGRDIYEKYFEYFMRSKQTELRLVK